MPEYQNFYFTYGTDPQFPFCRGFTVIIAPSQEAACTIFRQYHPCRTGSTALNCAWIYSENAFLATETASGKHPEEFCHEVIGPVDQCCSYVAEHPQYFPNTEGCTGSDSINKIKEAFLCRTATQPSRSSSGATLCPNCGRFMDRHEQRHGNLDIPYCKWCGQAIDWEKKCDPTQMKAVLASIHPQHCERIAAGEKTFEGRKSVPNLEPPFTCYIYQTKRSWVYKLLERMDLRSIADILCRNQKKVVGQFVCDRTTQYVWIPDQYPWSQKSDGDYYLTEYDQLSACLTAEEFKAYGKGDDLYGWHICDVEIYDKPIPITSFYRACNKRTWEDCTHCEKTGKFHCKQLERPPQSWCYVMEQ